jgi:hypothetical protein
MDSGSVLRDIQALALVAFRVNEAQHFFRTTAFRVYSSMPVKICGSPKNHLLDTEVDCHRSFGMTVFLLLLTFVTHNGDYTNGRASTLVALVVYDVYVGLRLSTSKRQKSKERSCKEEFHGALRVVIDARSDTSYMCDMEK